VIVVAGFNTALDKYAHAEAIHPGVVNRLASVVTRPGGKGVHAAQACALLGEPVRLVGIIDDPNAALFDEVLSSRRIEWRGVPTRQRIRSCYAIRDRSGTITELLEPGPPLAADEIARLEATFVDACRGADFAILSGSLPCGCRPDTYARLVAQLRELEVPCVVDTSGAPLASALEAKPALVKPNAEEAAQVTGKRVVDIESAAGAAAAIEALGIARVVISLGAQGGVAAWDGRLARFGVATDDGTSAVGSGDCFVGALASGIVHHRPADETLRWAAACGAANALSSEPGFFQVAEAQRLKPMVKLEWL
jgi:tagatose 6-phosphate kinase